jgi:hypothetical protein
VTNIAKATHDSKGMNLKRIMLSLVPTAQVQMLSAELLLARTARAGELSAAILTRWR